MNEVRFRFGENWLALAHDLDERQILEARESVRALVSRERLDGLSFLDIGSGSGLFSLVARQLGARVHSFDYDPQSVQSTALLRDRYFPADPNWVVEHGSVLDKDYLQRLGEFDIVYSWGVLHHTGAMAEAIRNAGDRVRPGGLFAFALYRKTAMCWAWKIEKRWYAKGSPAAQQRAVRAYVAMMRTALRIRGRDPDAYIRGYFRLRGMDFYRDVHDWLGGYPYESIRPRQVESLLGRNFERVSSDTGSFGLGLFGSGCDEYVYRRRT